MENHLYWIGCRETEIKDTDNLFSGSITIFGSGKGGNHAYDSTYHLRYDYNQDNNAWNNFVSCRVSEIIRKYPDSQFMLYYPDEISLYGEELQDKAVCQNNKELLNLLEDKHQTRSWLSSCVPILPYLTRLGDEIHYDALVSSFPGYDKFVIQSSFSCGGSGTHYLDWETIKDKISPEQLYSISPLLEKSISPNIHIVIYSNEVVLLPPSIQLINNETGSFVYNGADYVMYRHIPVVVDKKVKEYALRIGDRLRLAGYRGICGVDFLATAQEVYFMEVNARFQSSTFLLNHALEEANCSCSAQALHLDAFFNSSCSYKIPPFQVDYSFWSYTYVPDMDRELQYLHVLHQSIPNQVICLDDGLDWNMKLEYGTYLFKSVFHRNISALSPEFCCRLHSNINLASFSNMPLGWSLENAELWKIMLLNHGARISKEALEVSCKKGGLNFEEFEAVDMQINGQLCVSVPYNVNLSQLSPFEITINSDKEYELRYLNHIIAQISLRFTDNIGKRSTSSGFHYNEIAYLSNDRLRVYHRAGCYYKDKGLGCSFCDIEAYEKGFTLDDIEEVLEAYRYMPDIKHYLIGGGSGEYDNEFKTIIQLAEYIKKTTGKPIYVMSQPPRNLKILQQLKNAGVTEVAFNLEVYDRDLAKSYMPGKGMIPFQSYHMALKEAVNIWGNEGNVRTIFIIGLETKASLLEGIREVCKIGVSPILSLFKPIKGTFLDNMLAPSDKETLDIYENAKDICSQYGVELGPSCHYCEDNTLKVSFENISS